MNYDNMELVSDKILLADGSIISAVDGSVIAAADADRAQLYNTMPLIAAKLLQPDGSIINGSDGAIVAAADPDRASLYASMPMTSVKYITEGGGVLAGVGGGSAMFEWTPSSINLYEDLAWEFATEALTSLTGNVSALNKALYFSSSCSSLESISFPNLVSITGLLSIEELPALTTVSFPSLETCNDGLSIFSCPVTSLDLSSLEEVSAILALYDLAITSLDLSSLVACGSGSQVKSCASLTSIDLSSFVPTNGADYDFSWNALTAECVNAILARFVANASYVSGSIALNEGTNAEPTGQGLTDVTTLTGRGVTVTVAGEPI